MAHRTVQQGIDLTEEVKDFFDSRVAAGVSPVRDRLEIVNWLGEQTVTCSPEELGNSLTELVKLGMLAITIDGEGTVCFGPPGVNPPR